MIVKDLIGKLKILPADLPVLVQGYEDGFDGIRTVKEITVTRNPNAKDYNGEYEETEKKDKNAALAVVILGNRR